MHSAVGAPQVVLVRLGTWRGSDRSIVHHHHHPVKSYITSQSGTEIGRGGSGSDALFADLSAANNPHSAVAATHEGLSGRRG